MSKVALSTLLRRLRKERGWTQKDLAKRAGISRQQVSRYEWGGVKPRRKNLAKLADALDCSLDLLMTGRESSYRERSERKRRFRKLVRALDEESR